MSLTLGWVTDTVSPLGSLCHVRSISFARRHAQHPAPVCLLVGCENPLHALPPRPALRGERCKVQGNRLQLPTPDWDTCTVSRAPLRHCAKVTPTPVGFACLVCFFVPLPSCWSYFSISVLFFTPDPYTHSRQGSKQVTRCVLRSVMLARQHDDTALCLCTRERGCSSHGGNALLVLQCPVSKACKDYLRKDCEP